MHLAGACRARLQRAVGEAAGRGADVEHRRSSHVEVEGVEREAQLLAGSGDVVDGGDGELQRRVLGETLGRLGVRTVKPSSVTRPALTWPYRPPRRTRSQATQCASSPTP